VTHDDGFWEVAEPSALGLDLDVLERHRKLCENTGADVCLIVYQGKIVQEWTSPRYRVPMYAMSTTKSITGLLVGMLIEDGKIESIDEPVCNTIDEWCAGDKAQVTIRHLLSMTSGLARMRTGGVGSVGDKNPYVISLDLTYEPGTRWDYSNEGVQLLSPILDHAAGQPIQDYAHERLFRPLGMMDTRLHTDQAGHAWTHADMETTPRDLARIGLMMLNGGTWRGERIISEEWIEQSTRPSQNLNEEYGLLWWLHDDPKGFAGHGHLDTNLYIFPELETIVVRMQTNPKTGVIEGTYNFKAQALFTNIVPR
jgi:CubicO group peptidase (beta-lactamase class C family)